MAVAITSLTGLAILMTATAVITKFSSAIEGSLEEGSFVKLALGDYRGTENQLKNIHIRKIQIKREEKLSFTYH